MVPLRTLITTLCVSVILSWAPAGAQEPQGEWARRLELVLRAAREQHVDAPTEEALYRGAIQGALGALDPYSTYLDQTELERLRRRMEGRYTGIGVEIGIRDDRLTIITPFDGSPAAEAGLLAGDKVLEIDGKDTRGMTTRDSSAALLGEAGTEVRLEVRTPGVEGSTRTVTLVRGRIVIEAAKLAVLERPGGRRIAYVRIQAFQRNTAARLAELLDEAHPVQGVILDVRNNPGGLLSAAVGATALFLRSGMVVASVGRGDVVQRQYHAENAHVGAAWLQEPSLPLVVLINRGSASASEIVAGALQDRGRAVLIGETSFGKGSVQSIVKLEGGGAAKLTTARYRLPGGRFIDGVGLEPDLRGRSETIAPDPGKDSVVALALDVVRSWGRLRGPPQ